MQVKNTNVEEIAQALKVINRKYKGNIRFHAEGITSKNNKGTRLQFKLYTHDSTAPGHRRHFTPYYSGDGASFDNPRIKSKRSRYACWHVHGDFFDALLDLNHEAVIKVGRNGGEVFDDERGRHGNWEDWNIGSQFYPVAFSDSCDCNKGGN